MLGQRQRLASCDVLNLFDLRRFFLVQMVRGREFFGDQASLSWGGHFMDDTALLVLFGGALAVLSFGAAATFWFLLR